MLRFILQRWISIVLITSAFAQTAPPSGSPVSAPKPTATPDARQLIDSLTPADLQEAVSLLKKNFTDPEAISDTQLSRATIEGLMARLGPGLMVLPDKASAEATTPAPFYSEIIETHVGYLRLGTLNPASLTAI